MAFLYGLHHLPFTNSFLEQHGQNPAILHQQWVEEAKSSTDQAVRADDPEVNSFLVLLPCLFYSEHATKLTKVVQAFDDVDLASHIL